MPTLTGEGFEFDHETTLMSLLKACKLWDVTDRSVEVPGTVDGGALTKNYDCIAAGIKLVDVGLACLVSGNALNVAMGNVGNNVLTQSMERYFPLKIIVGQESKAAIEHFKDLYNFSNNLSTANDEGKCIVCLHTMPSKAS